METSTYSHSESYSTSENRSSTTGSDSSSHTYTESISNTQNSFPTNKETMKFDKEKIRYVIGIDLGHGETSAAICEIQWGGDASKLENAKDLEMGGNKKVMPSAITILPDGKAYIGDSAFNPAILKKAKIRVCFKQAPKDINGEAEQLMIRFMGEVYKRIRDNNSAMLTEGNHLVFIATPSGWDAKTQELYQKMAEKAGIPIGGVTKESRAAFVRAQHDPTSNLGRNIDKGAIVFDMGSSTLDFTYMSQAVGKMIDFGYDCGASFVEKAVYNLISEESKYSESLKLFEERYPKLIDYILFEARKIKEQVYFDPSQPVKKSVNYEDIVDEDEDLEDEKIKFKFNPGELNGILMRAGYLNQIREAMLDFKENKIPGKPIYGVYMTGGASRMDFLKHMITECWGVSENKIFRDQDPSLTISQGVAEVARIDLMTNGMDKNIEEEIKALQNNDVIYNNFSEMLEETLKHDIPEKVAEVLQDFRDDDEAWTLYGLQSVLADSVDDLVKLKTQQAPHILNYVLKENVEPIQKKVENIVAQYSDGKVNVEIPIIQVNAIDLDLDLSSVVERISNTINIQSNNWVKYALMGVGAVFGLLGAGIGYVAGKFFSKEKSEEEKKAEAMSKELNSEERLKVYGAISEEWDNIITDINESIDDAVKNNYSLKKSINKTVDKILKDYKKSLANARILVD